MGGLQLWNTPGFLSSDGSLLVRARVEVLPSSYLPWLSKLSTGPPPPVKYEHPTLPACRDNEVCMDGAC